ncbi:SDR family oxidoreductase [uncultured Ruegeria sp.]|uniref:SDR family oxidoreductase n=1 Tax=uncultured Ruegeria sp. TaxID=259304 RepID=UPI0026273FE3|nr:SDR family NAD(P)-dependent oxidoreductase [uncultured Ruegeria sp.]
MDIKNKHIVITGGASGLGLELLRQLEADNHVSVIARPSAGVDLLRKAYPDVSIYEADLADLDAVETAADALAKTGQPIDMLINNAAVQYTPRFTDANFRYETIRREIDVNFTSVCVLVHLLLPNLMQSPSSTIVNINSGLALAPKADSAIYCATKGALNIFSQSLAYQLEGSNVGVKQVFLPLVDTSMTKGRGSNKLAPQEAATEIIEGLLSPRANIDVGKVKALRLIQRIAPSVATRIMKAA